MNQIKSIGLLLIVVFSCVQCKNDSKKNNENEKPQHLPAIKLLSPANEDQFITGDGAMSVEIEVNDASRIKDMSLFIDDTLYAENLKIESQIINVPTENGKVGWVDLYLAYTDNDGKPHRDNRRVIFFSDKVPNQLFATKIATYPHSKTSYTQGLEFYKGKLYESTGQVGQSLIAEVDLATGNQSRFKNLNAPYFGEGITILNDTIYQITWKSNVCFLYDMDFNKIGELNYEGQGWGLCNNGKSIIMTSGDSEIVWRNPRTFAIEKSIYAFHDQSDESNLNEIELINDKLYINVYMENKIIEVDTTTGRVMSFIDCNSIATEGQVGGADVLNGIAYNPITGKTYITGKLWPTLFEVKFEE